MTITERTAVASKLHNVRLAMIAAMVLIGQAGDMGMELTAINHRVEELEHRFQEENYK